VGYRYFAQESARRLGLKGYVRNSPDGRVEGVACGTPDNLTLFQESLQKGPSMARVTDLEVGPAPPFSGDDFDVVS
jgi:acylphosphatase